MRRTAVALAVSLAVAGPAAAAPDPGRIELHPADGRPDALFLRGRVLEDDDGSPPEPTTRRRRNVVDSVRRLETDEIEGAVVEVLVGERRFTAKTDAEGDWRIEASGLDPPLAPGPHAVNARLLDDRGHPTPPATGWVHVLPAGPAVAILSDFDDTVVHSHVTDRTRMVREVLTRNAAQLEPVAGAPEAYRAARDAGAVAFFYVSGGPRNLSQRLLVFLELNGFPPGPVVMRDYGRSGDGLRPDGRAFKVERISEILRRHPNVRFILVGDSGERDPEVYRTIFQRFPEQVAAVVIRRVARRKDAAQRFEGQVVVEDFRARPGLLPDLVRAAATR